MKSFLKFCAIGCGVIILTLVVVAIFFGFKGFDFFKRGGKPVEIKGYETKIAGSSELIEFQNIGYQHRISGSTLVNFSSATFQQGIIFENVTQGGGSKTVVLFPAAGSLNFSLSGSADVILEDLFLKDSAEGKLSSGTGPKPNARITGSDSASREVSDTLFAANEVSSSNLSGSVSYSGRSAVLANPGGDNSSVQIVNSVNFTLTPSSKIYSGDTGRLVLPSTLSVESKDDTPFFTNSSFFTGAFEISGLNVDESASRANVATRGRNATELTFSREGNAWRSALTFEAFQVIVNDKVLIPAELKASSTDVTINLSQDTGSGARTVEISEMSGRGDAMLREVKVEGEAKDWIQLPKTKGIFGPIFEELPDGAKPFFILPTIFGVIFVDTFVALFQPDPIPDAILAGDTFKLEISAYPPSEGASLPGSGTATVTFVGKNYDDIVINVTIKE